MQRTAGAIVIWLALLSGPIGCSPSPFYWSTTPDTVKATQDLSNQIAQYRQSQSDRVERANEEYQDSFAQLMEDLTVLTNQSVRQGRDGDAQAAADGIIKDNGATLIGALRTTFSNNLKTEQTAITQADTTVASARAAYVKSYTDAKLTLSSIDKVQNDLLMLTAPEKVFDSVYKLGSAAVTAYQKLKSDSDAAGAKTTPKAVTPKS